MYLSSEDARSDFVLAAATMLFGSLLYALVASLPLYPRVGLLADLLTLAWLFALTGLVPLLLVRYRRLGLDGFGLATDRSGALAGLLVALPIVAVGVLRGMALGEPLAGVLGRLSSGFFDGVGSADAVVQLLLRIGTVLVVFVGGLLLYTFLTTRARDGFRPVELPLVEALRTFGMGATGLGLVFGLVLSVGSTGLLAVLLNVAGLAAMVLLTDRLVSRRMTTNRWTVLAPGLVALVAHVVAGGSLLTNLFAGALAAGVAIVVAVLVETRAYAWAVVPVLAAAAIYPTCLSPTALGITTAC